VYNGSLFSNNVIDK